MARSSVKQRVSVGGDVSGQILLGNGNIVIDHSDGAIVTVQRAPAPTPRRLPDPLRLLPRDFPGLLGRADLVGDVQSALARAQPVDLHSGPGWGKTALVRHLSHRVPDALAPEGIVCLSARARQLPDLLQDLFDACYEIDAGEGPGVGFKPSAGQLNRYLGALGVLVVVDDLGVDDDQLDRLLQQVPGCSVLAATEQRALWGEGEAIAVGGLPDDAAVELFERELGHPLTGTARAEVVGLCRALDGHPLRLLRAAALVRERGGVTGTPTAAGLTTDLLGSLPERERRAVGLLTVAGGAALDVEHVAALTDAETRQEAADALRSLARRGLAEPVGDGYRATDLAPGEQRAVAAAGPRETEVVEYVASRVERAGADPGLAARDLELATKAVELARGHGAWRQVRRIARGVSTGLMLAGLWEAWGTTLEWGLEASRQLGERAQEAWFLHQMGTRHLCLENPGAAEACLRGALEIRRSLGDSGGIETTQHNLSLIHPSPPWWMQTKVLVAGVVGALLVAGGTAAGLALGRPVVRLDVSPTRVDFGQVAVAGSTTREVGIRNGGTTSIAIERISVEGAYEQASGCPSRLGAGEGCTIVVTFRPTSSGVSAGTLSVTIEGGDRRTASLTGSGVSSRLVLSTGSIDFGAQPVGLRSAARRLVLRNASDVGVAIHGVRTEGDFAVLGGCASGANLGPGGTCELAVTFAPTAQGARSGRLVVDASGAPPPARLTGVGGVAKPVLAAAESFGRQSVGLRSDPRTLALRNAGSAPFTVSSVTTTGDFSASGCAGPVAPGGQCGIAVSFTPRLAGIRTGALQLRTDTGQQLEARLVGTGLAVCVRASPSSVDFDSKPGPATVTVVNCGHEGVAAIESVTITGDAFVIQKDGCSGTRLPVQGSCGIVVAADPQHSCAISSSGDCKDVETIRVADNSTGSPHRVDVTESHVS